MGKPCRFCGSPDVPPKWAAKSDYCCKACWSARCRDYRQRNPKPRSNLKKGPSKASICKGCGIDRISAPKWADRRSYCYPCHRKHQNELRNKQQGGRPYSKQFEAERYRKRLSDPSWVIKDQARRRLRLAVRQGRIIRQPCCVCGDQRSEAHHSDYERPFDVVWLCRLHHEQLHRQTLADNIAA